MICRSLAAQRQAEGIAVRRLGRFDDDGFLDVKAAGGIRKVDLRRSVDDPFKDTVAQARRKYDSHSKKDQNQLHKP